MCKAIVKQGQANTQKSDITHNMASNNIAVIDLGSNSFHLAVYSFDTGVMTKLTTVSEKVQLAAGLTPNPKNTDSLILDEASQQNGLNCLVVFAKTLKKYNVSRVRIVATSAMRQADNAQQFIDKAYAVLPFPISIISGDEEARLIYLGVASTYSSDSKRLVVDIGGGSTELTIGEKLHVLHAQSLKIGCVTYTQRFFANGVIDKNEYQKAVKQAQQELRAIVPSYTAIGWDSVVGSSGTVKAFKQLAKDLGFVDVDEQLSKKAFMQLKEHILSCTHVDQIAFTNLKVSRRGVLPAGMAILEAIFDVMAIEDLMYSTGALREGVVFEMLNEM